MTEEKIHNTSSDFFESLLKISSCVDSLLHSINDYNRNDSEDREDKLKKAQISFIKSLVVNDKASPNAKFNGFLYSTYYPYTKMPLIQTVLKHHNNDPMVKNFSIKSEMPSPLSLSEETLMQKEFSTDILNESSTSELWAKIVLWSNRSTKILDSFMNTMFGKSKVRYYQSFYNNMMDNLDIVNEDYTSSPAEKILSEKQKEDEYISDAPDAVESLKKVPRLTLERMLEVSEYAKEVGIDEALEEYSEYFSDKNDFFAVREELINATKMGKMEMKDGEVSDFTKYLVYKSRIRRLYQIKAVSLSEFTISNIKDNSAKCYIKDDLNRHEYARNKVFGIMLNGYSEPIEIHTNDFEIEECKNRALKRSGKQLNIPSSDFCPPLKTGVPFKLDDEQIKSIKARYVPDVAYETQKFLIKSFENKIDIPENERGR